MTTVHHDAGVAIFGGSGLPKEWKSSAGMDMNEKRHTIEVMNE
ncbi:hypothetical protein Q0N12_10180 [Rossellomorea marisflavi]